VATQSRQCTLAGEAEVKGIGLHTEAKVTLTLRPAEENHGLIFRRADLPGKPLVPVTADHIDWESLSNRTTLTAGPAQVITPEHVLSALSGMGIDNALIDLTAPECPAVDNSAMPFVEAIEAAGIAEQSESRRPITLTRPLTVRDEATGAEVTAMPSERFEVTFFAEYPPDYFLPAQTVNLRVTPEAFRDQVASARTWIFAEMIPDLLLRGLGQGGTRDTVLVIGKSEFVTEARCPDEPARHKVLDLIGDLALLGRPLLAHVMARRSGHSLHAKTVKHILEQIESENP
jgi:UDP-3-O-[3-hydroxymyristoyl] N-acetylglucosamine deacetylase/3-hydroxyacyl-[acyl-carrier-protein] dehydratase